MLIQAAFIILLARIGSGKWNQKWECKDNNDECADWAEKGRCNDPEHARFMTIDCPESCGHCEGDCYDDDPECHKFADKGFCTHDDWKGFMKEHCRLSCGFCSILEVCRMAHNKVRQLHKDTPDLEWDPELAKGAQEWANALISGAKGHAEQDDYGENIYTMDSPDIVDCGHAVKTWYEELSKYDCSNENHQCGHYTQVVWEETEKFGVGIATMVSDWQPVEGKTYMKTFIVARYDPPGNFHGEHDDNVLPRHDGKRDCLDIEELLSVSKRET